MELGEPRGAGEQSVNVKGVRVVCLNPRRGPNYTNMSKKYSWPPSKKLALFACPVIKVCRGKIVRVFRPASGQGSVEEERLGRLPRFPVGFSVRGLLHGAADIQAAGDGPP